MAESASPASDPRSLRRHYPHQVQGVVQLDLSAIAAPPHFYLVQNKTPLPEVNGCTSLRRDLAANVPGDRSTTIYGVGEVPVADSSFMLV
jgi:hypothetical protein